MCLYRTRKEHILVGGVWCACQKPPARVFLGPVLNALRQLETKGSYKICYHTAAAVYEQKMHVMLQALRLTLPELSSLFAEPNYCWLLLIYLQKLQF